MVIGRFSFAFRFAKFRQTENVTSCCDWVWMSFAAWLFAPYLPHAARQQWQFNKSPFHVLSYLMWMRSQSRLPLTDPFREICPSDCLSSITKTEAAFIEISHVTPNKNIWNGDFFFRKQFPFSWFFILSLSYVKYWGYFSHHHSILSTFPLSSMMWWISSNNSLCDVASFLSIYRCYIWHWKDMSCAQMILQPKRIITGNGSSRVLVYLQNKSWPCEVLTRTLD